MHLKAHIYIVLICSLLHLMVQTQSLIAGLETGSSAPESAESDSNITTTEQQYPVEAPLPAAVAPPPSAPPPPSLLKSSQFTETETLTWMMKCLQTKCLVHTH